MVEAHIPISTDRQTRTPSYRARYPTGLPLHLWTRFATRSRLTSTRLLPRARTAHNGEAAGTRLTNMTRPRRPSRGFFSPPTTPLRPEPHPSRRSHTPGRRPGPSAHTPSDGSVTSSTTTGAKHHAPVARSRQQTHGPPQGARHPDPSDGIVEELEPLYLYTCG